jgi:zinc protease
MTIGHFMPLPGSGAAAMPSLVPDTEAYYQPPQLSGQPDLPEQAPLSPGLGGAAADASGPGSPAGSSPHCRRFVLSNGLTLLVQPNHSNPTLALSGLVRAGIAVEPHNLNGLALVHAQMLDRGTARRSASQIAEDLEIKGASLYFSVNHEEINLMGKALSEDLSLLMNIVAESLTMPTFPEDEFGKVRREVLAHCQLARDNAQMQAWQGFNDLAYPEDHPMRRSLITAEAGLKKIVRKDLVNHHRRWVRPENTILSLAGDLDPEKTYQMAEKLFQSWRTHDKWEELTIEPMVPVTDIRTMQREIPGKTENIVVIGHEGLYRKDPEYYEAYVANHLLGGGGLSSLLMRSVRDREGLTYSIYSQFKPQFGQRPWYILFQADPVKVAKAVAMTLEQVRQIQAGRVSEQELDDSREQLMGELSMSLETNGGIAYLNREVEYHGLGPDYLKAFPLAIKAVTFDKMVKAAKKWFHPDRYLLSIAGQRMKELDKQA